MTEINLKEQIKKLVELQKIDGEIYELKISLEEKPAIVEQLKNEFEEKKAKLKEFEEKLKAIQLSRKEKEVDLKGKEDEIIKANSQLSQLKTNKEYSAKISEIEHLKADKSVFEEKILNLFEETDDINVMIEKERSNVAEQEKLFLQKKKQVDDEVKLTQDRIKVLESQKVQAVQSVDPDFLSNYEKILKGKSGSAIVPLVGNSCGGCFMNVTHQTVNLIKMHKELVVCQMCSRILYIEEDL